jgi:hypothetical protein
MWTTGQRCDTRVSNAMNSPLPGARRPRGADDPTTRYVEPLGGGKRGHCSGGAVRGGEATLRPGVRNNPPEIGLRKVNKSDAFWTSRRGPDLGRVWRISHRSEHLLAFVVLGTRLGSHGTSCPNKSAEARRRPRTLAARVWILLSWVIRRTARKRKPRASGAKGITMKRKHRDTARGPD